VILEKTALAIDTTAADCSVALVDKKGVLAQDSDHIKRGHAERLAPMVQNVLAKADMKPAQIDRIAVCNGPGSFTGLRVGLSFAKGFALPHQTPVLGISALKVMAAECDSTNSRRVISVIDVRRGQVCWQIFDRGVPITDPKTQTVHDAFQALRYAGHDEIAGDGASLLGAHAKIKVPNPSILGWIALDSFAQEYPPVALYSRAPDAKPPDGKTPVTV